MKLEELLVNFVNADDGQHERVAGRYYASEINSIIKGYLKPKNFFNKKNIDLAGARMIISGIAQEDMLYKILKAQERKFDYQAKKEIDIGGIVLVVKPDFLYEDYVLETKFPFRQDEGIPERYRWQLEAEYRAFERKVLLGKFSIPFNVEFMEYKPDEARWEAIKKALHNFHDKLTNEIA